MCAPANLCQKTDGFRPSKDDGSLRLTHCCSVLICYCHGLFSKAKASFSIYSLSTPCPIFLCSDSSHFSHFVFPLSPSATFLTVLFRQIPPPKFLQRPEDAEDVEGGAAEQQEKKALPAFLAKLRSAAITTEGANQQVLLIMPTFRPHIKMIYRLSNSELSSQALSWLLLKSHACLFSFCYSYPLRQRHVATSCILHVQRHWRRRASMGSRRG